MKILIIFTSIDNKKQAKKLAKKMIDQKIAACVTMSAKSSSFYIWKNKNIIAQEYLLLIKTTNKRKHDALNFLKKNHPYETPEIIVLNEPETIKSYFNWVEQQTSVK